MNYGQASLQARQTHGGLLSTRSKVTLQNQDELATYYSPGIAEPCRVIAADPSTHRQLTVAKNLVAVISDGSAVLGLGNIGGKAALPVMEGKCLLLKNFADVDGIPIVLDTQDTDEIIQTIKNIAPTLGGINLEDIAAPRCFEIEEKLTEMLDIPVFHDDQHGTAMVVLAALINALRVTGKSKTNLRVTIAGAGAAGIATAQLLQDWGLQDILMVDSQGVITCDRENLNSYKQRFCSLNLSGDLATAVQGADVFIGVSKADTLTPEMVQSMADQPIIFALANPNPEIKPELAQSAGAAIIATGRSDYPNQINNVLVFPGFFRGLIDGQINQIDQPMKLRAAQALADLVQNPTADKVVPHPFDPRLAEAIATAVQNQ